MRLVLLGALVSGCGYRATPLGESGYAVAFPRGTDVEGGAPVDLPGGLRWRAVGQALDTSARLAFAVLPAPGTRFEEGDRARPVLDALQAAPGLAGCLARSRTKVVVPDAEGAPVGEQVAFVCAHVVLRARALTGPAGYFVLVLVGRKELGLDPGEDRAFLGSLQRVRESAVVSPSPPRRVAAPAPQASWFRHVDFR